jgi:hypothetical protein
VTGSLENTPPSAARYGMYCQQSRYAANAVGSVGVHFCHTFDWIYERRGSVMIVEQRALFIRGVDVNREGRGVWFRLSVCSNVE